MEGNSSNTRTVEIKKEIVEQEDVDFTLDDMMKGFDLNYPQPQINEEQGNENADTLPNFDSNYPEPQILNEVDDVTMDELLKDFDFDFPEPQINEEQEKESGDTLNELLKEFESNYQELEINDQEMKENDDSSAALDELLKEFDSKYRELQINEPERATKRTRTSESDEVESILKEDGTEWELDPLEITEQIVVKYHDFIQEIYQMLTDEQKDKQKDEEMDEHKELKIQWKKWKKILERANVMVETLNEGLKTLAMGMEWMKSVEELKEKYSIRETHVPDLIALLRDINTRIESSPHFRVVSDLKNRDEVIKMCLYELERSKEELTEMVEVIHELKAMDSENDDNVEGGELDLNVEDFDVDEAP